MHSSCALCASIGCVLHVSGITCEWEHLVSARKGHCSPCALRYYELRSYTFSEYLVVRASLLARVQDAALRVPYAAICCARYWVMYLAVESVALRDQHVSVVSTLLSAAPIHQSVYHASEM